MNLGSAADWMMVALTALGLAITAGLIHVRSRSGQSRQRLSLTPERIDYGVMKVVVAYKDPPDHIGLFARLDQPTLSFAEEVDFAASEAARRREQIDVGLYVDNGAAVGSAIVYWDERDRAALIRVQIFRNDGRRLAIRQTKISPVR